MASSAESPTTRATRSSTTFHEKTVRRCVEPLTTSSSARPAGLRTTHAGAEGAPPGGMPWFGVRGQPGAAGVVVEGRKASEGACVLTRRALPTAASFSCKAVKTAVATSITNRALASSPEAPPAAPRGTKAADAPCEADEGPHDVSGTAERKDPTRAA